MHWRSFASLETLYELYDIYFSVSMVTFFVSLFEFFLTQRPCWHERWIKWWDRHTGGSGHTKNIIGFRLGISPLMTLTVCHKCTRTPAPLETLPGLKRNLFRRTIKLPVNLFRSWMTEICDYWNGLSRKLPFILKEKKLFHTEVYKRQMVLFSPRKTKQTTIDFIYVFPHFVYCDHLEKITSRSEYYSQRCMSCQKE